MPSATLSRKEVSKHDTEEDLWVIVDHKVYDLSDFVDAHPGGSVVLTQVAGQDATQAFYNLHRHEILQQYSKLCIGVLDNELPEVIDPQPGDLSRVPYAEPLWLAPQFAQFTNQYYKDSHRRLQKAMRVFVEVHVTPEAKEKEKDGTFISQGLIDKMAEANILAMRLGPGKHLHGRVILGGGVVEGEEFDYFHDLIVSQELTRHGQRGFQDGNMAGMTISLTAVRQWLNNEKLRDRITEEVLSGKKKMSLAITEAFAGSDVAGLRTTAEVSDDGQHYIINGTKKWITNGMFSDYFVTGCKTKKGFSVILVPKTEEVEVKLIKTSYSTAAATTYIQFNNVKVPRDHLLGEEDNGFTVIMSNFNHERWMMSCMVTRWTRTILTDCLLWSHQRHIASKPLIAQPLIRHKLARLISLVEANQAWLVSLTHQMNGMTYAQQSVLLSGPIGLLKAFATRSAHEVADEATNIFGGRGLTVGGMGAKVEMFHRTYKFDAILGGTEEVLMDLGVRQAMRFMPNAKL
ncbi:hypothetical protein LTR91_024426 [Friedmanniomyces endolithicus]|uniref:Cytochrome b5 heme-binding domain-containing protein n=1 Tax=Friedmanniomyces endolithicus TaxID=329885 RepID=A0AAN6H139_9PEZI|nr:hypothetical protein LTR91_024426 [Friedmanniomyces endolithicus]